ncbi:TPA: hypothetical protein ACKMU4_002262, partial [Neisseria gonorrhoeae]
MSIRYSNRINLIYCVPKKGRLTKINALYFLQVTGLFFLPVFEDSHMEDKQGMTKAVAGVMTDAPADGRKPATASNLPPPYLTGGYGNRNGGQGSG